MLENTLEVLPAAAYRAVNRLDRAGRENHGEEIVVLSSARSPTLRTTHLPNELALKMDGA